LTWFAEGGGTENLSAKSLFLLRLPCIRYMRMFYSGIDELITISIYQYMFPQFLIIA